jgi:hypothetical protein
MSGRVQRYEIHRVAVSRLPRTFEMEIQMSEDAPKPQPPTEPPPRPFGTPKVAVNTAGGGDEFEIDIRITVKPSAGAKGGAAQAALGGSWATCGHSCPICPPQGSAATCGGSCPVCPGDATKHENGCTHQVVCGASGVIQCVTPHTPTFF